MGAKQSPPPPLELQFSRSIFAIIIKRLCHSKMTLYMYECLFSLFQLSNILNSEHFHVNLFIASIADYVSIVWYILLPLLLHFIIFAHVSFYLIPCWMVFLIKWLYFYILNISPYVLSSSLINSKI